MTSPRVAADFGEGPDSVEATSSWAKAYVEQPRHPEPVSSGEKATTARVPSAAVLPLRRCLAQPSTPGCAAGVGPLLLAAVRRRASAQRSAATASKEEDAPMKPPQSPSRLPPAPNKAPIPARSRRTSMPSMPSEVTCLLSGSIVEASGSGAQKKAKQAPIGRRRRRTQVAAIGRLARLEAAAQRCAEDGPGWRARLRKGDSVDVFTRNGGPHWARAVVISIRRQNLSVKFPAAESTDGDIHVILPRASQKLRALQAGEEEKELCQKAVRTWPRVRPPPRRRERLLPPPCRSAVALEESQATGSRKAALELARLEQPSSPGLCDLEDEDGQRQGVQNTNSNLGESESPPRLDDTRHALTSRVVAWEVPLARAEKATRLVRLFQEEIHAREREARSLLRQRVHLQKGLQLSDLSRFVDMRLMFCPEEPTQLQVEQTRALAGMNTAGLGAYDFPLSCREKLRRLVHLYEVDLGHSGVEIEELRRVNRTLWAEGVTSLRGMWKGHAPLKGPAPPRPPDCWL